MRKLLATALLAAAASLAHATDVGVSITVGDPNFFGRIDIGDVPRPELIYAEPVIIRRVQGVVPGPMYLRVPPGHEKNWDKHCSKYDACGMPVYFVRDTWYNDVYVPAYRSKHPGQGQGQGQGNKNKNKSKGHGNGQGQNH